MTTLDGKVALVTGGSASIGRAIVERLSEAGAQVAFSYRSSEDKAKALTEELQSKGRNVAAFQADISEVAQIDALFEQALKRFSNLDIVVANAGMPAQAPMLEVTPEGFDQVFRVNARGVYFTLRAAARYVADGGRIINISSSQTVHPAENFSVYAGSKAAPMTSIMSLAQKIGARGVTVNSIVVGPIDAGFLDDAPESYKQRMADASALKRLGTPEDIAGVAAFLASDDARYITGQQIVADGGATHF